MYQFKFKKLKSENEISCKERTSPSFVSIFYFFFPPVTEYFVFLQDILRFLYTAFTQPKDYTKAKRRPEETKTASLGRA